MSVAIKFDFDTEITADITLYAKYNPNAYDVTFHANNATEEKYSFELPFGEPIDTTNKGFSMSKHIFVGWSTRADALPTDSDIIKQGMSIKVEDLTPGDKIRIGWLPDRVCIVEYVGGRTFKAIDAVNATLQTGDTFECSLMLKNYPLFVDNLVHGGEHCPRYSMGLTSGLTTLEKL